jgi:membrane protein DedA with SNARE-associated domain
VHFLALLNFTNFVSSAGYAAVFILCVLQSCCVPTSSEITMGFAGVLAAQGKLSLPGVIVAGVAGEVIGAYIAWAVGRYAGRRFVDRFGRYILLTHRDLDRAQAWYERHERFGVFGSRLLPVIRNFVALPAGIAEVPLGRFGVLTAGGSLLWDGAWAGLGYGLASYWNTIAKGFGDLGYVLAVVVVGVLAFGILHRYNSYKAATAGTAGGTVANFGTGGNGTGGKGTGGGGGWLGNGGSSGRHVREPVATTGAVRWVSSSSGRPPTARPMVPASAGADRWVASSSGQPRHRRRDFANSPVAAWEAAVVHGRRDAGQPPVHVRRRDFTNSPLAAWEAAVVHGRREEDVTVEPLLDGDVGVESNSRLTAMLGAVLLVLLAIEGLSILRITSLLTLHVVIGMVLVPVIILKLGTTSWRFVRYYLGSPAYRRKGPPPPLLRLLGPFVVVSSIAVIGSGIALLVVPTNLRTGLLLLHKVTFVLWFAAMVVHVLGHLLDVTHIAPRDFYRRTRGQIRHAGLRQWAIVSAVCIGILLGVVMAPKAGPWLSQYLSAHKPVHAHAISTPGIRHRHS